MKILLIFNREPYDNTDVTWNGLRLAGKLVEGNRSVPAWERGRPARGRSGQDGRAPGKRAAGV